MNGLQFLAQKVFALIFLDFFVEFVLNFLLNPEKFLLLFDVDKHLLHSGANIDEFKDFLLLRLFDVQDRGDEVGDFSRMVDIHHVEAHFLAEKRIVLAHLLHFADERPGQRLHFLGVVLFVVQILDGDRNRVNFFEDFADFETLHGGDENIESAVGKVDFLYDSRHRSNLVQIGTLRMLKILVVFDERNSYESVLAERLVNRFDVFRRTNHKRREDSREHRPPFNRNDEKFVRKQALHGNYRRVQCVERDFYRDFFLRIFVFVVVVRWILTFVFVVTHTINIMNILLNRQIFRGLIFLRKWNSLKSVAIPNLFSSVIPTQVGIYWKDP